MILFNSKTPQWEWLSNFHIAPITIKLSCGVYTFQCVEAAYQCGKQQLINISTVPPFTNLNGWEAKQRGKLIDPIREDWPEIKGMLMMKLTHAKFDQHLFLRASLLATDDEDLIHYSPWDTFWGVDEKYQGQNQLGIILMQERSNLNEVRRTTMP